MAKDFAKGFYNSKEWQHCRDAYIEHVHGLCERCHRPGWIVHHKCYLTPDNIEDPDVTLSADDREIGGLGIFMTKQIMDDVVYSYKDGQNILELKKKL